MGNYHAVKAEYENLIPNTILYYQNYLLYFQGTANIFINSNPPGAVNFNG